MYQEEHLEKAFRHLEKEVNELKIETKLSETERLKSLFTTYARCLGIGCAMQLWQQLDGINTAMYYGPDILIAAGVKVNGLDKEESALLLNIPLALVNAIGTLISCFVIDSFGRRYIILRTMPGAAIGWLVVSVGMLLTLSPDTA